MNNERVILTRQRADELMPPGEFVHTIIGGGSIIIGCDWPREKVLRLADAGKCELAGETATRMKHGIVVFENGRNTFIATN